jgi:hypothetical protein
MTLPPKYETLLDLYDSGSCPPDEQIELAQFLLDTGLNEQLTQYTALCEYMVLEGMCYDVGVPWGDLTIFCYIKKVPSF